MTRSVPKIPLIAIIRYRCSCRYGTMKGNRWPAADWSTAQQLQHEQGHEYAELHQGALHNEQHGCYAELRA